MVYDASRMFDLIKYILYGCLLCFSIWPIIKFYFIPKKEEKKESK